MQMGGIKLQIEVDATRHIHSSNMRFNFFEKSSCIGWLVWVKVFLVAR